MIKNGIIQYILTGNFIPKYDVFAQVISDDLEESNVYTQLSNILDNTEQNLGKCYSSD